MKGRSSVAVLAGACVAVVATAVVAHATPGVGSRGVAFPLKPSKNRRYLVDQRNTPFLLVGDSPQAMIGNLSVHDAASFIANRKAAGFNALWVNLLCATYTGCRDDGTTFDGIAPFTRPGTCRRPIRRTSRGPTRSSGSPRGQELRSS